MDDIPQEIAKNLVESCKIEHADAVSSFAALDTKAQNTITVAGIFVAGALAFFRADVLQQLVTVGSHRILVLLGLVVVILISSIVCCISAMRIRDVSISDTVLSVREAQNILKEPAEDLAELYLAHLFDQANEWNRLSSDIRSDNERKAAAIRRGQILLAIAILFVGVLLLYTLYAVWHLAPAVKGGQP